MPEIKPTAKAIRAFHESLTAFAAHDVTHELAVRSAFQQLLAEAGKGNGWLLIPELRLRIAGRTIIPDGTLRDEFLVRGYWEAKDADDDLSAAIDKKIALGYPLNNTIFEDSRTAVLFQGGAEVLRVDVSDAQRLATLLSAFFAYAEPNIERFEQAIDEFKDQVPELALGLAEKIRVAHKKNKAFADAFSNFFELCKTALNPNMSVAAVDEMLVQHLLTERLLRTIFNNPDFIHQNVIANEIEKVISALVKESFSRSEFLKSLDRFYVAIEDAARGIEDFGEKQRFLNTVYERFFQGYSIKVADTHGIVYTPQPLVEFMADSVNYLLTTVFDTAVGRDGVNVLDPCTGTGNFVVNILRRIAKRDIPQAYRSHLFANEVMLLPYYVAALNIEHSFYELAGAYEPFDGLCFVDTLDLTEGPQTRFSFMTEANTQRVARQRRTPITVIVGNPPYNMGQVNANDANKNRKYEHVDERIRTTYAKDSDATLKNKLYDPYVKFFRWATDRLGDRDGIICYVTNNSFVDQTAFDGMRKHLHDDFSTIYHLDLQGNVRHHPKLSGTAYNVFGIQLGVGITVAIRRQRERKHRIFYHVVPPDWRREVKLRWLTDMQHVGNVAWQEIHPDARHNWHIAGGAKAYTKLLPLGSKQTKKNQSQADAVFANFSPGIVTSRDEWAYDFTVEALSAKVKRLIENYNAEVTRHAHAKPRPKSVEEWVNKDPQFIKWSDRLLVALSHGDYLSFDPNKIRRTLYRPFVNKLVYFDNLLIQRRYQQAHVFPNAAAEKQNLAICCTSHRQVPFSAMIANCLPDSAVGGRAGQVFPLYTYDESGSHPRDNITDWALDQFQDHYRDASISKRDIFNYVYGTLHEPSFRSTFSENLRRDLARIPFLKDFWTAARVGAELANIHLTFSTLDPWPLTFADTSGVPLSYHVGKLHFTKDRSGIAVNGSLTLRGVPPAVFTYAVGARSAIDWIVDQYETRLDSVSQIVSDPNDPNDPERIVRLVGQVIRASMETLRIVAQLL